MQTRFSKALSCFFIIALLPGAYAQEQGDPLLNYRQCNLQQAIDIALRHNPELIALEAEAGAAAARRLQAALWPNPTFSAESENFSGNNPGFSSAENTFSITQPLLLGGKITLQKNIADAEWNILQHDYEKKRVDLITDVEHAVYDILLFQQNVVFAQENKTNSQKLLDFVSEKNPTQDCTLSQHELLSAKIELSQAAIEVRHAEKQLESAKRYLANLWGQPEYMLDTINDELDRTFYVPEYESLKKYVLNNNYEIKAIKEQQKREDIALRLAQAERIPDIDLGFGVRQFAEDDSYSFVTGLSFPLPLFNRNQGKIQEAIDNQRKIEAEIIVFTNSLILQLEERYRDYQDALQTVRIHKTSILPMAQEYFDLTLRGYQEGTLEYLEVLNAARKLTESKKIYTEELHHLQIAVADLEKLCAKTFHGKNADVF